MANTKLLELFPAKYRDYIIRYQSRLPTIFNEYDVVVFMARKAICFYKALVTGKFIDKPGKNCKVFSSRVLTYNVATKFKNKRVIVIDDVLIKGNSLKKVLRILSDFGVNTDVFIMARPPISDDIDVLAGTNVIYTYAEISEDDTDQLSKHIADFIEASVCPYNIDQPIYEFKGFDKEAIATFAERHMLIDISSELQRKYDIKSFVLEIPTTSFTNIVLQRKVELCKIRFLFGQYMDIPVFLAIPFVLLGEMSYDELTESFESINTDQLYMYIFNKHNKNIFRENQLKILHYILSAQLMDAFLAICEISSSHRLNSNDDFVFADDIFRLIKTAANSFEFTSVPQNSEIPYNFDFIQTEYLDMSYDFLQIQSEFSHRNYFDSDNEIINQELLVRSELRHYIMDRTNDFSYLAFSNIIDVLIDSGFIIPSVVHGLNGTIVRAYKCGEVFALNQKHFELFTYALKKYLDGLDHKYMLKTEFEKLCVLFFREAVRKGILQNKEATGEEDRYSICYSKFGPRVSTSKPIYSADQTSTLAAKLLNLNKMDIQYVRIGTDELVTSDDTHTGETLKKMNNSSIRLVERYNIHDIEAVEIKNPHWESEADLFAANFVEIFDKLFSANDGDILFNDVRNMHMRTYLDFLIMLSIGANKKDQLLSLLAEIYLYSEVEINASIKSVLYKYMGIIDALLSGMWKYMCYVQSIHPMKKVCENLAKDKANIRLSTQINNYFETNTDVDQNKNITLLINEIGTLIFSMFYSLWFMSVRYFIPYKENDIHIDLSRKKPGVFFYNKFDYLRKAIDDQVKASSDEQNIATLHGFQDEAKSLINRYNIEIAEGRWQAKKSSAFKTTIVKNYSKYTQNIGVNNGVASLGDAVTSAKNITNNKKATIGIITALEEEWAAMLVLLSNIENDNHPGGHVAGNRYVVGELASNNGGIHKVVLALLPNIGNNFAAAITEKLQMLYPTLESIIVCGIAGGVPSVVRLGDIVVSTKGVIQYDFGQNTSSRFIPKDDGASCSAYLLEAIKFMEANALIQGNKWEHYVCTVQANTTADFNRPSDVFELYESINADGSYSIKERTTTVSPMVYREKIGSSNAVQKNAKNRDQLYEEHKVYAIEMEASGVGDATLVEGNGYLVIRGICDYCDKTKADNWHNYAAAVAAAYTRSLIESLPT